jgi:hypothetical protein
MRHLFYLAAAGLLVLSVAPVEAQVYGDNNSLVNSWYQTYLGRAPDAGAATWVTQLNQGTPADQVLAQIIGSDEFYQQCGSTPQGFITRVFSFTLQRAPTPAELDYWVRRMYTTDRGGIADALLTQHPGVWVSSAPATAPVVPVPPGGVRPPPHWERDRHGDWAHHHQIYDYRRPEPVRHGEEHRDHRR